MPSRYPSKPWRVSLYTTACDRVVTLEDVANDALRSYPQVRQAAAGAVAGASRAIAAAGRIASLSPEEARAAVAAALLLWTQRRGYKPDPAGEEWFQPVPWTIARGGDCEDLSTLFVTLARAAGLRAQLVWIDQPSHALNHVTAQVYLGDYARRFGSSDGWAWAETSVLGARLGENPYHAAERLGQGENLGVQSTPRAPRRGGS
jgi:transglutaminase-like putative cysteine protease